MSIWLARHAPVAVQGVCYGQHDVPVAIEAEQAAERVISRWEALGHGGVPELWSSPWVRTRNVAEVLSRRWGAELHVDARLSELSFGEWEGRRFDDLEREDGPRFARWMCAFEVEAPPRGETVADLRMRLAAWVEERRRAEAVVLAITHAGVIRMARSLALGIAFADVVTQEVEHLAPERVPPSQFRVLNA